MTAQPVAPAEATVSGVPCASCGASVDGAYCSRCGERRLTSHDLSMRHFVAHSLHDVTHLDTKLFRSLRVLLTRPGQLPADYVAGRRTGRLGAVQFFVMMNMLFFFIVPKLGLMRFGYDYYAGNAHMLGARPTTTELLDRARQGRPVDEFRRDYDEAIDHPKRLCIFVMVALFAAVLAVMMAGRHRYLVEHVVFALDYYTFWMALMMMLPLALTAAGFGARIIVRATGISASLAFGDAILISMSVLFSILYLFAALRRFYGSGAVAALAQSSLLTVAMLVIFMVYRAGLFLLALQLV